MKKLEVTPEAAAWYRSELDVKPGDYIRFIVKLYGGIPTLHPNYFLGLSLGKDGDIAIQDVVDGVTFYFHEQDSWMLEHHNLKIVRKDDEVQYIFE